MLAAASAAGVCDLFEAGGTPCVAAFSLTRALFGEFDGALYRVRNSATNATLDVGPVSAGGVADVAAQERFCGASLCIVEAIYDQSHSANHLGIERGFDFLPPPRNSQDAGVNLTLDARVSVSGSTVYSAIFASHCSVAGSSGSSGNRSCDGQQAGYSNRTARNTPVGDEPQTVYALYDGNHYNTGCCFEFGNAEKNSTRANGSMMAVYFGCGDGHAPLPACETGPYVYSDLEHMHEMMTLPGFQPVYLEPVNFVFALVKGEPGRLVTAVANAQKDDSVTTLYDGPFPPTYVSVKQGGIILGVGGDNSPWGSGTWFEGVMTRGFSSSETDAAVLANIVAAKYVRLV